MTDRVVLGLVLGYCSRLGLPAFEADDVWQTVLVGLASRMRTFRYEPVRGRFRTYLFRCVRNAITNERRRRGTADTEAALEHLTTGRQPELHAVWEREWVDHHLLCARAKLRTSMDPRSVAVFDSLLSGASVRQVARKNEMSESAVHKVKQRVRTRLHALVSAQLRLEDA